MLNTITVSAPNTETQHSLAASVLSDAVDRYLLKGSPFKVLVLTDDTHGRCKTVLSSDYFNEDECKFFEGSLVVASVADVPTNTVFDVVLTVGDLHNELLRAGVPPRLLVVDQGEYIRVNTVGDTQVKDNVRYGNGTPLDEMTLQHKTAVYIHSIHFIPTRSIDQRHCKIRLAAADGRPCLNVALRQSFSNPAEMERFLRADILNRNAGLVLMGFDASHYYAAMYLVDSHSLITEDIRRPDDLVGKALPKNVSSAFDIDQYAPKPKKLKAEDERLVIEAIYRTLERHSPKAHDIKQRARIGATIAFQEVNKHLSPADFELIWANVNLSIAV